jgi:hypothetical protein
LDEFVRNAGGDRDVGGQLEGIFVVGHGVPGSALAQARRGKCSSGQKSGVKLGVCRSDLKLRVRRKSSLVPLRRAAARRFGS